MARKKNQPKNKNDCNSSDLKSRVSELESSSIARKGQAKIRRVKVFMGEEVKENQCAVSTDDFSQKTANGSDMEANNDIKTSTLGASHIREGIEPLPCSNHVQNHVESSNGWPHIGLHKSHIEKFGIFDFLLRTSFWNSTFSRLEAGAEWIHTVLIHTLRTFIFMVLKASAVWLAKQKPLFIAIATYILKVCDYARAKFEFGYPFVLRMVMHSMNIVLFISMVWLDCALRGVASFLCMGTASIFSVIWFSIFSVVAMSGILKVLMILAMSAFIGAFVGFTLAVFVVAFSGIVLLWLYGNFWMTFLIIFIAGLVFFLSHEHLALLIATVYSLYCVWAYNGWTGLLLGFNLSFFSSDVLVYLIKNKLKEEHRKPFMYGEQKNFPFTEMGSGQSSDCRAGVASTSGVDAETTSEDEVIRLLNCTDHYSALGFSRFETIDGSLLKREYKKKAMLVHPDKNMGNEKAAEAFKKLQNAYEVLFDSLKRRTYDDGLKREELLNYFRGFQSASHKQNVFAAGFAHSEGNEEGMSGESRQISCKRCGKFHIWVHANKLKSRARWCQDCKDFHEAKDGDGWVEQYSQPFFFGLLHKVDSMCAYVCVESRVYDATEWYICQGAKCAWNSHKASFQVNTKWKEEDGKSESNNGNIGKKKKMRKGMKR